MPSTFRSNQAAPRFPWEEGRACGPDRALGLELELIELVHARDGADGDEAALIDRQIDATMADLAAEAAAAPGSWLRESPAA